MAKCTTTLLMVSITYLLAQANFLQGIKAEDLMLDRIEKVSADVAEEIADKGVDYWYGTTLNAAYSPDGLFYAEERTDKPGGKVIGVWIINSKTKEEKKVITGIVYDLKWSATGKFLAFSKMVPTKEPFQRKQVYGDGGRWVYNIETDKLQSVPLGSFFEWSSRNNWLAGSYVDSAGCWLLAVYDAGKQKTEILDRVLYYDWWNFSWSANGEMLAYVVATKASGHIECAPIESEVFVINRDGTGKTQITHTSQPEIFVKWLSDGKSIMVERYKEMPDSVTGGGDIENVVLKLRKRGE